MQGAKKAVTALWRGPPMVGTLGSQGTDQTLCASVIYFGKNYKDFFFPLLTVQDLGGHSAPVHPQGTVTLCGSLRCCLEVHHKTQVKGKDQTTKLFCWTEDLLIHRLNF